MSIELWLATFAAVAVACLVVGLAWPRYRWAPLVATGLVMIA